MYLSTLGDRCRVGTTCIASGVWYDTSKQATSSPGQSLNKLNTIFRFFSTPSKGFYIKIINTGQLGLVIKC